MRVRLIYRNGGSISIFFIKVENQNPRKPYFFSKLNSLKGHYKNLLSLEWSSIQRPRPGAPYYLTTSTPPSKHYPLSPLPAAATLFLPLYSDTMTGA